MLVELQIIFPYFLTFHITGSICSNGSLYRVCLVLCTLLSKFYWNTKGAFIYLEKY